MTLQTPQCLTTASHQIYKSELQAFQSILRDLPAVPLLCPLAAKKFPVPSSKGKLQPFSVTLANPSISTLKPFSTYAQLEEVMPPQVARVGK